MNFSLFLEYGDYPTTLSTDEIANPYRALDHFFLENTPENLKKDTNEFFISLFKAFPFQETHDPAYFYRTYKIMIRLIDIILLIVRSRKRSLYESSLQSTLDELPGTAAFGFMFNKNTDKAYISLLKKTYQKPAIFIKNAALYYLLFDKSELLSLLEIILSKSQMGRFYYYSQEDGDHGTLSGYRSIQSIINISLLIWDQHRKEPDSRQKRVLDRYKIYGTDLDHPSRLSQNDLEHPLIATSDILEQVSFTKFCKALKLWQSLIQERDYWKKHNDPGNILFLKERIERLIDSAWLILQIYQEENFADKLIPEDDISDITLFLKYNIEPLLAAINGFFLYRPLHVWKQYIDQWTLHSLSSSNDCCIDRPGESLGQILQLINTMCSLRAKTYILNKS